MDSIASTVKITSTEPVTACAKFEGTSEDLEKLELKVKPFSFKDNQLIWYGADALFFIESIWSDIQRTQGISQTFAQCYGKSWSSLRRTYSSLQVKKIIPEAIIPSKAHPLDTGYDVSVVRIVKENFGPGVVLYGTGLVVRPPDGYYIDLIARSSLCKMGYIIANSVGVIDAQYRGELCIPLAKISNDALPLQLPARIAQIVIRELHVCDIEEVDEIGSTQRGSNGFGSSGK
jgi:dUTP pyrophosphatase